MLFSCRMKSTAPVRNIIAVGVATLGFLVVSPALHATNFGPTAYVQASDSPFSSVSFSSFYLQNFESFLAASTPAPASFTGGPTTATLSPGGGALQIIRLGAGNLTDSVDADDGGINGSGTLGVSLFNSSGAQGITVTFSGSLPSHAGLVWTDGAGTISFEAFNQSGVSLGIVSGTHADGSVTGQTGEDRFYGASNAGGISSFRIWNTSGGIEVDHLQFGIAATNPTNPNAAPDAVSTLGMFTVCVLGLCALRRRRA